MRFSLYCLSICPWRVKLQVCGRCVCAVGTAHQAAIDQGYIDPNEVSNRVRTHIMNKPAITTEQDSSIHRGTSKI